MILKEATIGGVVYLAWNENEMALPESERVGFNYGPLSNKVKIKLLHESGLGHSSPNGVDVCKAAIDDLGKKITNLKGANGEVLDTVAKCLAYQDADNELAYMLEIQGLTIWRRQMGEEVGLKN